ncbi:DUF4913 domain-containing protein [Cryobacterium sp. Y57]|uniref:DUF4913 domain-containing protein n=1 Tax=Cryobacterium sp. Y57 TaxID=2048287 RepID=UPI000CE3ED7D|nr:DUF4913 domain-containing protein [Cryobacterium sp. Y57]
MSDVAFSQAREALRLKPTFGMSVCWRDHADHHMRMLMSPEGPFETSRNRKSAGDPLPPTHHLRRHVRQRPHAGRLI